MKSINMSFDEMLNNILVDAEAILNDTLRNIATSEGTIIDPTENPARNLLNYAHNGQSANPEDLKNVFKEVLNQAGLPPETLETKELYDIAMTKFLKGDYQAQDLETKAENTIDHTNETIIEGVTQHAAKTMNVTQEDIVDFIKNDGAGMPENAVKSYKVAIVQGLKEISPGGYSLAKGRSYVSGEVHEGRLEGATMNMMKGMINNLESPPLSVELETLSEQPNMTKSMTLEM